MKKVARISLICVLSLFIAIVVSVGLFFMIIEPSFTVFGAHEIDTGLFASVSRTVTVVDAFGNPIDDVLYDKNKIYVKVEDLNDYTVNAFIAIEDKRFYKHKGVDYKRMASALLSDIKARKFKEGASTITQQLIKNTHLSNKKTLRRKIDEIRLARKLERMYDKNQILECYLNVLYFGSGIRGLGTASRVMFDKPASELSIAQSAALASIINNPAKYSPYNNYENLTARKELVLNQMLKQHLISDAEYRTALTEEIVFEKNIQSQFSGGVIRDACNKLACGEKQLFAQNYTLKTAYNPVISAAAKQIVSDYADFNVRILVLDNKSGGIACDQTNISGYINPRRSPASAIKPFISYAPALESGLNPMTQISDEPTAFGDYSPNNYNNKYRGYLSLKDCLIYSSNVAAVKLLDLTGIERAKTTAKLFGVKFNDSDTSLALALGGMTDGLTLVELANAYRTLANGGLYSEVHYVLGAENDAGTATAYDTNSVRAVSEDTAYLLTDMLSDCAKYGTAKKLKYCGNIAAKTGTNGDPDGNRDCYCIAYTPEYTVAVWFGSDGNNIPNNITGAKCCDIVKRLCSDNVIATDNRFTAPDSVAYYDIDGIALQETHEVYLADPLLPKRYRQRALLSKNNLPIRKSIDIIDFYDLFYWTNTEL